MTKYHFHVVKNLRPPLPVPFPIAPYGPTNQRLALSGKKIFHRPKPSFSKGVLFCQLLNLVEQKDEDWHFSKQNPLYAFEECIQFDEYTLKISTKPKASWIRCLANKGLWFQLSSTCHFFNELPELVWGNSPHLRHRIWGTKRMLLSCMWQTTHAFFCRLKILIRCYFSPCDLDFFIFCWDIAVFYLWIPKKTFSTVSPQKLAPWNSPIKKTCFALGSHSRYTNPPGKLSVTKTIKSWLV